MREIVRDRILKKYNYKCVECNSIENLEVDHIIPLSRGGKDDEINKQVLCRKCNRKKGKSIDYNKYFRKGDDNTFMYVSTDLPLGSFKKNELIALLDQKFEEFCND